MPALRPLSGAFYAIEISRAHRHIDGTYHYPQGEVKRSDGQVIPGLYACGNDINSIMSGSYPGPGITLDPALTFGYIVGQSAAGAEA